MLRALIAATLVAVVSQTPAVQPLGVLHIKVTLVDAENNVTPVARHALLISDNPPSASPRRIVTKLDGSAEVRLRPGNYTVESDEPLVFQGKAYIWTQNVDIVAGRDATLDLSAGNADVEAASSLTTTTTGAPEVHPGALLTTWQDSVLAIWTPTMHASGFVIDRQGLVATSLRSIGAATSMEVQLTPAVKVAARVLVADRDRNVAILWIDPKVLGAARPVPMGCGEMPAVAVAAGQDIFTLGIPLRGPKDVDLGTVTRVEPHAITSDLRLSDGSAGGPVFAPDGRLAGISVFGDEAEGSRRREARVIRIERACDVVAAAMQKMKDTAAPEATLLPVEPTRVFPAAALQEAAKKGTSALTSYQLAASDFDVTFITPPMIYGEQYRAEQASRERRTGGARPAPDYQSATIRPLVDFGSWSEYVIEVPPVLLVRVTPKLVEGFWAKVGRAAASTQGVALPAFKHFSSGFGRLRAFCGEAEVTPIHPFKVEQRVSESDAIYEGLYVFDPGALGPHCGTVKLALHSEKEPEKPDTRIVEPKLVERIWQDFAAFRAGK